MGVLVAFDLGDEKWGVSPMFENSGHSHASGGGRLSCLWFFVTNSLISQDFNKLVWTALYCRNIVY